MSEDWTVEYERLRREAASLPEGETKRGALERCVQLADAGGDLDRGFQARKQLIWAVEYSDRDDVGLAALAWCLAQCDRDPKRFPERGMLMELHWMAFSATQYPQIAKARVLALIEDLRVRLERVGLTLYSYYDLRARFELDLGLDRTETLRLRDALGVDDLFGACKACDVKNELWELVRNGASDEVLVERGARIVASTLRCRNTPHWVFPPILLPALRVGRRDDAAIWARRGERSLTGPVPDTAGWYLAYYAHANRLDAGLRLLTSTWRGGTERGSPEEQLDYAEGARLLLRRVVEQAPPSLRVAIDGAREPRALKEKLDARAWDLARRFDRRNENRRRATSLSDADTVTWIVG